MDRLSGDITAGRGHPAFPRFLQRSGLRGRFSSVSPRPETTEEVLCVCVVVVVVIVNKIESF